MSESVEKTGNYKLSMFEKVSFGMGDVGCVLIWNVVGMFLTIYYTDNVMISAAAVAAIMLSVRIFDGLSDLVMGYILDHSNFKMGKARPWILISAPFMAIFLVLCFSVPSFLGETGKVIYAFCTYFFLSVVVYTACNLSYSALVSFLTEDLNERAGANSVRFVLTGVLSLILGYVTPVAAKTLGWFGITAVYGAIAFALLLLCVFVCKERVKPQERRPEDKVSFAESVKVLSRNVYFYYIVAFFMTLFTIFGVTGGSGMYLARYVLHDDAAFGNINMAGTVAQIAICFVYPWIMKAVGGKWNTIVVGFGLVVVANGICVFALPNEIVAYSGTYWLMLFCMALRAVGTSLHLVALFSMIADVAEYGEWKTGRRLEGATYSVSSFGFKIGIGIGGAIVGLILAMVDYDSTLEVQPEATLNAIMNMNFLVPMCLGIFGFVLSLTNNLDKVYPTIMKELVERRAKEHAALVNDQVIEEGNNRAAEASSDNK